MRCWLLKCRDHHFMAVVGAFHRIRLCIEPSGVKRRRLPREGLPPHPTHTLRNYHRTMTPSRTRSAHQLVEGSMNSYLTVSAAHFRTSHLGVADSDAVPLPCGTFDNPGVGDDAAPSAHRFIRVQASRIDL